MLSRTVVAILCLLVLQPLLGRMRSENWGTTHELWAQDSTGGFPDVLIVAPGEFRRQADRMQDALKETQYLTAASHLDKLCEIVADRDFFLVEKDEPLARGMKGELWQTAGELPSQVLEAYEDLVGSVAASRLQEASRDRDADILEAVADRWFAAKAGVEARLLLARIYLDWGQPHEALRILSPLRRSSVAAERYEPEINLLRACAYLLTNRPKQARAELERLAAERPEATFRISNHEIDLRDPDTDALARLTRAFQPRTTFDVTASGDWLLHRKDARRSALSDESVPARWNWTKPLTTTDDAFENIRLARDRFVADDIPAVPSLSPIAMGNQVVFRTTAEMRAVDSFDGKMLWRFPPNPGDATRTTDDVALGRRERSDPGALRQRIWEDSVYGQVSSDGRRVFLIDEIEPPDYQPSDDIRLPLLGIRPSAKRPPRENHLVALDLSRQGALLWMVGGPSGEAEPALAEAFFLGPPLPVGNHLFVIAQQDYRLLLVKLDPETGRQLWQLPYAKLETDAIVSSTTRTLAGATPSYSNGALVCPTNVGAVVAVDPATRRFLWGYRYAPLMPQQSNQRLVGASRIGQCWTDSSAMIVEGIVLITPPNADLQCLDLSTGKLRWRRRRTDLLFVAATHQGTVLLVGHHRFTALRIADGTPAWSESPFVAIPAGGMPSGRGFLNGRHYYLPTTDPELLQIDILSGEIVRHRPTDETLGNLICCNGCVMSQGPLKLTGFDQRDDNTSSLEQRAAGATPSVEQMAEATVGELVAGLSRSDFRSREAASRELLQRGGDAVERLVVASTHDDPEVMYRSTAVLIQLLDGGDVDAAFRARQALVSSRNGDAHGAFAARAFAREVRRREPVARKKLQELGATMDDSGKKISLGPRWKGQNEGLIHLQWLSQLQTLELRHSQIDDDGLRLLRGLDSIQSLNLHRTHITSEGVAHLAHLRGLRTLLLQKTQVDDRALPHLKKLKRLRAINLLDTDFTDEGVENLRKMMPNVQVLF